MPYAPVTLQRLTLFLERLTQAYRRPGRLYLVGGTGLLYQGIKASPPERPPAQPGPPPHVLGQRPEREWIVG